MTRYRVAVVGLEHYHMTGWVESFELFGDQIEIVALYDPDPRFAETLAPRHHDPSLAASLKPHYRNLPFTTDLDRLIAEQRIDVALVTLPPALAPDAIERLARAGIHLLIDKPGARTAAEAERAFAAVRESGVKATVGLTRRHGQGWKDAKALIDAGRVGKLFTAEALFTTSAVRLRDPKNQIFSKALSGGGILHWLGVHDLDILLWLTGERVVELQAMTGTVNGEAIDVEDAISVALRFESGALGTVHYAYALPRWYGDGYLALRGSAGSIRISPDGSLSIIGPGSLTDPVSLQETTYTTTRPPGYGATGAVIIDDLLRAIAEDREPVVTGEHVTAALRIIDAAYESAASGRRIRLDRV